MNLSKPTFPIIPNDINNTGYYTNCVQFLCRRGPAGLILPPRRQAPQPGQPSRGSPPHYAARLSNFFFFLKVNGPISHQLFSRNPSKGLKGSTQLQPIHIWKLFSTGGAPQGRVSGERRERRGDGHTHPSALGGLGVQSSCQAGAGRLTRVCEAGVMCAVAPRRLVSPEFRTCRAHRGLHVGSQVFTDLTGTLSPIPRLPAHLEPRR